MLQRVAACCSVLQRVYSTMQTVFNSLIMHVSWGISRCVAACCSVFQRVATWCSVLQCVAACCSVLQRVYSTMQAIYRVRVSCMLHCAAVCCNVLQSMLQFGAVCCSDKQCVVVSCSGCSMTRCVTVCWRVLQLVAVYNLLILHILRCTQHIYFFKINSWVYLCIFMYLYICAICIYIYMYIEYMDTSWKYVYV